MTTATLPPKNQQHAPQPAARTRTDAGILELVLDRTTRQRCLPFEEALLGALSDIEQLLPEKYKGQARNLARRAIMTLVRNDQMQKCTPESIAKAVVEAAEFGLAIDGRMAYAIPYGNQAKFMPSYLGMLRVAMDQGIIKDYDAHQICANDDYDSQYGTESYIKHKYARGDRGKPAGAWCKLIFPDGSVKFGEATFAECEAARMCSKQPNSLMWKNFRQEGDKKTIIRRMLKPYGGDTLFSRLLDQDDGNWNENSTYVPKDEDLGPMVPTEEASAKLVTHYDDLLSEANTGDEYKAIVKQQNKDKDKFTAADWEKMGSFNKAHAERIKKGLKVEPKPEPATERQPGEDDEEEKIPY